MLFVIDLDLLQVIKAATDKSAVVLVEGKRGDDSPFEVVFVRSGVAEELAGSSVITFGAKRAGKYDGTAVVLNNEFALSGAGITAKYLASPSFNTVALNALFVIDGDDSNDVPYVDLMAEFTWQVGAGAPSSTKTFTFRVHNDVIRGTEGTPMEQSQPTMIRTAAQGPPNIPQSITIVAGAPVAGTGYDPSGVADFTGMDGGSPTYFGGGVGGDYPTRSAFYSVDRWKIQADVDDAISTDWDNFEGTPAMVPETDYEPGSGGDFSPADSSLDVTYGPQVEAAYIGQFCRFGDAAPYEWYQAETLTSWVNRTAWVIELLAAAGDGLGVHEISLNSAGGTSGILNLYSDSGFRAQIYAPISYTANRTLEAPDNEGTLAIFGAVNTVVPTTGNTITVSRYQDRFYYLNPAGTLATLTLALPASFDARDGQKVSIFSTQTITALTVSASSGNTMGGTTLSAMVANTLYEFIYSTTLLKWIRIK